MEHVRSHQRNVAMGRVPSLSKSLYQVVQHRRLFKLEETKAADLCLVWHTHPSINAGLHGQQAQTGGQINQRKFLSAMLYRQSLSLLMQLL
jgi:hypothetical protein